MDIHNQPVEGLLMAKSRPIPKKEPRQLHVGPWIRACKRTPAEVSRGTGINEGYLSQIISGQKKNPSAEKLMQIAEFLEVPLGDLYKAPPPQSVLDQLSDYDPSVVVRLSQKRRKQG